MSHLPGTTLKPLVKLPKDPTACWEWLGATDRAGNARKSLGGTTLTGRRWLWSQLFGPVPAGLVVTTICGNRTCTNPYHLRACTQAEANRQAVNTLLLPADVTEIRAARKNKGPATARMLANRYGVHPNTIRDIWRRRSWSRPRANPGPGAAKAQRQHGGPCP